ncbi:hypothetical protein VTJ04DRAFT_1631 [Mycothermus thermophilus]|uniref:uncharacterized protein n=1 Tax=Humicola insolens TaxID=85995 RepID=UPI00374211FF
MAGDQQLRWGLIPTRVQVGQVPKQGGCFSTDLTLQFLFSTPSPSSWQITPSALPTFRARHSIKLPRTRGMHRVPPMRQVPPYSTIAETRWLAVPPEALLLSHQDTQLAPVVWALRNNSKTPTQKVHQLALSALRFQLTPIYGAKLGSSSSFFCLIYKTQLPTDSFPPVPSLRRT